LRHQVNTVMSQLEWAVSGYGSICEGYVDYSRPLYACVICKAQYDNGHTAGCPIRALREMKD
jgi:hypothetical protein